MAKDRHRTNRTLILPVNKMIQLQRPGSHRYLSSIGHHCDGDTLGYMLLRAYNRYTRQRNLLTAQMHGARFLSITMHLKTYLQSSGFTSASHTLQSVVKIVFCSPCPPLRTLVIHTSLALLEAKAKSRHCTAPTLRSATKPNSLGTPDSWRLRR
jgi:hypothetical protein